MFLFFHILLNRIMFDAELFIELGVCVIHDVQVSLLNGDVAVWIIPCFCLVKGSFSHDLDLFLIVAVGHGIPVSQLHLQ